MPTVFIPSQLRELTGGVTQVELSGRTIREIVAALESQFPGIQSRLCNGEELSPALQVTIDDNMTSRGLAAQVDPESEVHFLPAIAGG